MPSVERSSALIGKRLLSICRTVSYIALTLLVVNGRARVSPECVVSRGRMLVIEAVKKCVGQDGVPSVDIKLDVQSDKSSDGRVRS